ncbi:MAG TPA: circularly permuted type 2 ATP-grasp protein [Candidatus Binataceae bacterium]|nr:circularly permuted type 2 ATP-grasp protein [Candidatus Binataceae bacterium]
MARGIEDGEMNGAEAAVAQNLAAAWGYQSSASFHDEMLTAEGQVRPHWRGLTESVAMMGAAGLARRWQEGRRLLHDNGVTYNVYGDPRSTDRPWPLDPLPLVIDEREWAAIDAAMVQRATLLNAMLADFYGPQNLLRENLFPPELVFRSPGFLRACCNVNVPENIYLHNYSADLARSPDGKWWVIADRTQAPSGAGYALENRLVSQRVLPDVFGASHVRRLADYFQAFRETLRSLVPRHRDNPRIVLLTPGPYNETYFEHAFLARYLGYTLVEGGDLTVRDNCVFLKTLGGLLPVDLIMRRQDDSFCDPLELREDSVLGVPGLVQAVRLGNVAVVNALGSGLLESAASAAFLPSLCRHLLGEELKMPTVATWWCGQEKPLAYVTENISRLVIKPTFLGARRESIFGAKLTAKARERLAERIRRTPRNYVAQEQVSLSTVPVWEEGGHLAPRHLVLRVYVTASEGSYIVMPGGLTRMTAGLDSLVASMQHGGGSKDTWVLSSGPTPQTTLLTSASTSVEVNRATFDLPSRVADNLFWLGRYVERVDSAVRIARAILSRLQESDPASAAGLEAGVRILCSLGHLPQKLLASTNGGAANGRETALEREMLAMIYDSEEKTSLGWTLEQLRRVAWLLRDRFSADAWRVLNRFDQQFSAPPQADPLRMASARSLLDDAIMTLSAFGGLAMESMTRGDGWRFLDIGRRLERALQVVEILRSGLSLGGDEDSGELQALLEIADSSLTYRSRYLTSMQADLVLDLLLLDEANPRSAAFQLARLREHVEELPKQSLRAHRSAEWRVVVPMLTAVQLGDASELIRQSEDGERSAIDNLLGGVGNGLKLLSETIARDYFDHSIASRQLPAS